MNYRKERYAVHNIISRVASLYFEGINDDREIEKAVQKIFTLLKHSGFRKVRTTPDK